MCKTLKVTLLSMFVLVSSTLFVSYGAITEVLPLIAPESMLTEAGDLKFGYTESLRALVFLSSLLGLVSGISIFKLLIIDSDA